MLVANDRYNIGLLYNGATKVVSVYINGALITSCTMRAGPSLIATPVSLFIGKSEYPEDPTTSATITNMVFYNQLLSRSGRSHPPLRNRSVPFRPNGFLTLRPRGSAAQCLSTADVRQPPTIRIADIGSNGPKHCPERCPDCPDRHPHHRPHGSDQDTHPGP